MRFIIAILIFLFPFAAPAADQCCGGFGENTAMTSNAKELKIGAVYQTSCGSQEFTQSYNSGPSAFSADGTKLITRQKKDSSGAAATKYLVIDVEAVEAQSGTCASRQADLPSTPATVPTTAFPVWAPNSNDTLYQIDYANNRILKIVLGATQTTTPWVTFGSDAWDYAAATGSNVTSRGFDTSGKMFVLLDGNCYGNPAAYPTGVGYGTCVSDGVIPNPDGAYALVDLVNQTYTVHATGEIPWSSYWQDMPSIWHGHTNRAPDYTDRFVYGTSNTYFPVLSSWVTGGLYLGEAIGDASNYTFRAEDQIYSHPSWNSDNDWWVGESNCSSFVATTYRCHTLFQQFRENGQFVKLMDMYGFEQGDFWTESPYPNTGGPESNRWIVYTDNAAAGVTSSITGSAKGFIASLVPAAPAGSPVIDTFTSNVYKIVPGGSATLKWTTTNASSVWVNNGVGDQAADETTGIVVSPTRTTEYTMRAIGSKSVARRRLTIEVVPLLEGGTANLLSNGGFESGVAGAWTISGFGTPSYETDRRYEGVYAMSGTRALGTQAKMTQTLCATGCAAAYQGKTLVASAWVKTNDPRGGPTDGMSITHTSSVPTSTTCTLQAPDGVDSYNGSPTGAPTLDGMSNQDGRGLVPGDGWTYWYMECPLSAAMSNTTPVTFQMTFLNAGPASSPPTHSLRVDDVQVYFKTAAQRAEISYLRAVPASIRAGQPVRLEWGTQRAESLTITPEPGTLIGNGRDQPGLLDLRTGYWILADPQNFPPPATTTTYTATATGSDGVPVTRSTIVTVY